MVDRVYKADIPRLRRALIELRSEFSKIGTTTDWTKLRIDPLLQHLKMLEELIPKIEQSGLRGGVPQLHSDLVYFRRNVDALRGIIATQKKRSKGRLRAR